MNRQRLILFILLILLAVAALWSYSAMPRLKTATVTSSKPGQTGKQVVNTAKTPARGSDDGTVLKMDLLDKEPSGFKGYRRNFFKPIFIDEVKAAKQKIVVLKPAAPPVKVVVPPTEQIIMAQPEAAPLARFTFLGFIKKGAVKTIFLSKDKDILLVKTGDKIAGRYEATEISDLALTLTVTDTGDKIVIPLVENRPLAAAK